MNRYRLSDINGTIVELYPDKNMSVEDMFSESKDRVRNGTLYSYKWGDSYEKLKIPVSFVDTSFKNIVNNWYSGDVSLILLEYGTVRNLRGTIDASSYTGKNFYVGSEDGNPRGLEFNRDKSKMYMIGLSGIYQYDVTTPGILDTSTYTGKSFNVSSQDTAPSDLNFNEDESIMYMIGTGSDHVHQYDLISPGEIDTSTYTGKSFNLVTQDASPRGLEFNQDKSVMYMLGTSSSRVYQYEVNSPGEIDSLIYNGKFLSVSAQDSFPTDLEFNKDISKMYMVGVTANTIYQYKIIVPGEIDTSTYIGKSFSVDSLDGFPVAIELSQDESQMYVMGSNTDRVYELDLTLDTFKITNKSSPISKHMRTHEDLFQGVIELEEFK